MRGYGHRRFGNLDPKMESHTCDHAVFQAYCIDSANFKIEEIVLIDQMAFYIEPITGAFTAIPIYNFI